MCWSISNILQMQSVTYVHLTHWWSVWMYVVKPTVVAYAANSNFWKSHVIPIISNIHCKLELSDACVLMGHEIHCASYSSVARNWVPLEFNCHPKSSVTGFHWRQFMHWHSTCAKAWRQSALTPECHSKSTDTHHTFNPKLQTHLYNPWLLPCPQQTKDWSMISKLEWFFKFWK